MAGHKRGRTCWRPTSRHRRCWGICGAGQADHTLTASQPRSNGQGYSAGTAVRYLRAAAHPGHVVARQGACLSDIDLAAVQRALAQLADVRAARRRRNHHTIFGAQALSPAPRRNRRVPPRFVPHADRRAVAWSLQSRLRKHRGASDPTIKLYARDAAHLMAALAIDPERWEPKPSAPPHESRERLRQWPIEKLTTSLRAFLRYLVIDGLCRAGLDDAVPATPIGGLPTCRGTCRPSRVNRLIAACDGEPCAPAGIARSYCFSPGLGCVPAMWRDFALAISSGSPARCGSRARGATKSGYRCPRRSEMRSSAISNVVLEVAIAITSSFAASLPLEHSSVATAFLTVVRRVMKRAGVTAPAKGAHALRHTAATQMLRHGVPLDQIALVLRHRGIDTTAYYAKADVGLLKQIAQPWPEMLS